MTLGYELNFCFVLFFVCACVQDRACEIWKAAGASGYEHAGAWSGADGLTFESV